LTLSTVDDVEGDEDDLDVPDLVARSPSSLDDSDSDEEDDDQPPRIPPKPPPQRLPSTYATSSLTTHRHTTIAAYQSTTYTTRAELDLVQLKECLLSQLPLPLMTQLHIKHTFYSFTNPCTLRNLTNICCVRLKCGPIRSLSMKSHYYTYPLTSKHRLCTQ
jgi:hypothetical protein